ncbi:hypothetical protein RHMOL_Rhmol07G0046800 [Rhododendron molle]|uniref:Uncharacterized protein n=1 Tax=Rhododendron molle TaxID=49168 RepID=A0ACC0MYF8_RHOML|nr:hypothetical protein RHMOL_Rhmol07G0046800 [Rhododendron molle]
MFRQAAARILSRSSSAAARARPLSTDLAAAASPDETFVEAWKKVIPNIEPPKTPSSFMTPRPATPSSIPSKLTVNFAIADVLINFPAFELTLVFSANSSTMLSSSSCSLLFAIADVLINFPAFKLTLVFSANSSTMLSSSSCSLLFVTLLDHTGFRQEFTNFGLLIVLDEPVDCSSTRVVPAS